MLSDAAAPWFVPVFFSSVHAASLTVAVVQVACVSDFEVIVSFCEVSVAIAAEEDVVAGTAVDAVVAQAAGEAVVPGTAEDPVRGARAVEAVGARCADEARPVLRVLAARRGGRGGYRHRDRRSRRGRGRRR